MFSHYHAARRELTAPTSPFAVTEIEVRGFPSKVFANAPLTMREIWESTAAHADNTYLVYEDERYTYDEVAAQVRSLAQVLSSVHEVGSGDRVAIAMRNYPEWVVAYWASVCVGAAVVRMNAWWTPTEMEYGLLDSAPKVLIADDERLERVQHVLDNVRANRSMHIISVRSERRRDLRADVQVGPRPSPPLRGRGYGRVPWVSRRRERRLTRPASASRSAR